MKDEARKQRLKNLTRFGKALNAWHFVYAVIFLTLFPHLTKGTTIHEHVALVSTYGTLGILIAPFYIKWIRFTFQWYVKTGKTLESLTFVPMLLVGALIGTLITYAVLRIFKHKGNWEMTISFSYEGAIISLFLNLLSALFVGLSALAIIYYREGQHIFMKHKKPMPFWQVLTVLFVFPVVLLSILFVGYLAN